MTDDLVRRPGGTIPRADDARWKGGFTFASESGNEYTIAYDTAGPYWVCSCKGGVHYGRCKHLREFGRSPTRADVSPDSVPQRPKRRGKPVWKAPTPPPPPAPVAPPRFEPSPVGAAPLKLPQDLTAFPVRKVRITED